MHQLTQLEEWDTLRIQRSRVDRIEGKAHLKAARLKANELRDSILPPYDWHLVPTVERIDSLTDEEIDSARDFPMEQLVGADGKIECQWHQDSSPSMVVYHDHVHCFVCGKHLNTIGWQMEVGGMSFYKAVKSLQ